MRTTLILALSLGPLAVACGTAQATDKDLLCSVVYVSGWIRAPSDFNPQGVKSRRLSPADRRRVDDPSIWRELQLDPAFVADPSRFCNRASREVRSAAVSHDGRWARAEFTERYQSEVCLAQKQGDRWFEHECDITMIVDPIEG